MNTVLYTNEIIFKNFKHLEIQVVPAQKTAWLYFNPSPRPCFTLTLVKELCDFQSILKSHEGKLPYNGELVDVEYTVMASHQPVFSFGGDLNYFIKCIESNDRNALRTYAKFCINVIYHNQIGRELDITTISLVHGSALGGGFECALCTDVLVAERNAEMGLPEVLFNLFPGMGAYQSLSHRVGPLMAEKMMLNGRLYDSSELYDLGIIDVLAEDGEGKAAVNSYIRKNIKRKKSVSSVKKIRQLVNPINYQQLLEIGDLWVDTAFDLSEKDIRFMKRLVYSQERIAEQETNYQVAEVSI